MHFRKLIIVHIIMCILFNLNYTYGIFQFHIIPIFLGNQFYFFLKIIFINQLNDLKIIYLYNISETLANID